MRINFVFAIVAIVLLYPTWRVYESDRASFTDYTDIPRLFAGFDPDNIGRVVISTPKLDDAGAPLRDDKGNAQRDGILIVKTGADSWVIGQGVPVAGVAVRADQVRERVLRHLEQIRSDPKALVHAAADEEALARFGLDADHATLIQAQSAQGVPMAELFLGKASGESARGDNALRGYYVRRADSNDVVLYEQDYWLVAPNPDTWVDRNPLRFRSESVVELSLMNELGQMAVVKDAASDLDWKVKTGPAAEVGAPRSAEITSFVRGLTMLNIQRYVEPLPQAEAAIKGVLSRHGLVEPKIRVAVRLDDGATHTVEIGDQVSGANEYYLRISSVGFLMTVGDWVIAQFEREPAFFFDPPASAVVRPDDGTGRGGDAEKRDEEKRDGGGEKRDDGGR